MHARLIDFSDIINFILTAFEEDYTFLREIKICIKKLFNLKKWAESSFGIFHDNPVQVKLKFKKEIADDVMKSNFHQTQQ